MLKVWNIHVRKSSLTPKVGTLYLSNYYVLDVWQFYAIVHQYIFGTVKNKSWRFYLHSQSLPMEIFRVGSCSIKEIILQSTTYLSRWNHKLLLFYLLNLVNKHAISKQFFSFVWIRKILSFFLIRNPIQILLSS